MEKEPTMPVQSQALEVNLQRTAVEVRIPRRQQLLLELTEPLCGIHQETEKLLIEINHSYIGWKQALEDLHYRAMGDFFHYNKAERGAEALAVFCSLYERAATAATPETLRDVAIRYWLYYLEKIADESGENLLRNSSAIKRSLQTLRYIFADAPAWAVSASPRLKRLCRSLLTGASAEPPLLALVVDVYRDSLQQVHQQWLALPDAIDWYRDCVGAEPPAELPRALAQISHASLQAASACIEQSRTQGVNDAATALIALADNGQIVRGFIDAASSLHGEDREPWQDLLRRIAWLSRVLGTAELTVVHETALHDISRLYTEVLRDGDRAQLRSFVQETFAVLRRTEFANPIPVLDLLTAIGTEVMKTGDRAWIDAVVDELIAFDFQYPRFSGFTDEWQVKVNPAHLKNIRTYLALIKEAPHAAGRLLAALVVQLKIGGVFLADTDLFQKDISQLLAADIRPVYDLTKQLCKVFPVYFSDIGAEGELRDASTRLDEIRGRRDLLCHFIRKQCHVESNPKLVTFIERVATYWASGEKESLRSFLPDSLYHGLDPDDPNHGNLHRIFSALSAQLGGVTKLFALDAAAIERLLAPFAEDPAVDPLDIEKAALLLRVRALVGQKYEIDHRDVVVRLRDFHRIDHDHVDALERALLAKRYREALALLLEILETLQAIVLSEGPTQAVEDIYHKRHVAVGIPSMYGRYKEERFEAMGLTFRVESLGSVLFEQMISEQNLAYITKSNLQIVAVWLRMLLRALRLEGFRGRGLEIRIWMLEQALQARGVITVDQYVNIFQLIGNSIKHIIRIRFLDVYESSLETLIERMRERGVLEDQRPDDTPQELVLRHGESFLRDLIAQSFGLQRLDSLVSQIIFTLTKEREKLDVETLNLLMTYDVDRCFVQIEQEGTAHNGHIYVGNKGFMLKRLAHYGFPVPHGFILTTEVFRCRRAIEAYDELRKEHTRRIEAQIHRLEELTGARYGDVKNPLLISVRSGAAISMPGMLDSFLNVGMNEEITAGFARARNCGWAAWDAYRRFLQFWGMAFGIHRDHFDQLMQEKKRTLGVEKKSQLSAEQMRELALRYRALVWEQEVAIVDDPWEQLHVCIDLVLRSWDSHKARVYRKALQIAEEWGTAVIVQRMVYGNLSNRSGTGVVFTRHPQKSSEGVELYGDFVLQGQGDDVVSGLVETFPINERQRVAEHRNTTVSLERAFPAIYEALAAHSQALIGDVGMSHQEIEFTFEGPEASDLYVLQSRDIMLSQATTVSTFVPSAELEQAKVATGIGVGGGALCGRVAHSAADITALRESDPEGKIILIRPDTVPDDIHMVLQASGLLTAIGGATSHAAVASQRLGMACVVGTRVLDVDEKAGVSRLAGHRVATGDYLSINGEDGSIYLGQHAIVTVRK